MGKLAASGSLVKERKQKLLKRKINLVAIHENLISFVVQDVLTVKYPKKKLLKVVLSALVALKVQAIFPENPRVEMVQLFEQEQFERIENLTELRSRQLDRIATRAGFRKNLKTVLSTLFYEIGQFIPQEHRVCSLQAVNEAIPFLERRVLHYHLASSKGLKERVAFELESDDPSTDYTDLLSNSALSNLFRRASAYPTHPSFTKENIKAMIISWKASTPKSRRQDLLVALQAHDIQYRQDSSFCNQYIEKNVCCELEEVVATMGLTKALFSHSHVIWSNSAHTFEQKLKRLHFEEGHSWLHALDLIIQSSDFRSVCTTFSLRRGECWKCGSYGHYSSQCFY